MPFTRPPRATVGMALFAALAACGGRLAATNANRGASTADADAAVDAGVEMDGGSCPADPSAGTSPCDQAGPVLGACVYLYFGQGREQLPPSGLSILCLDAHGSEDSSSFASSCVQTAGAGNGAEWYPGQTCAQIGLEPIVGGCVTSEDASSDCTVTWYNGGSSPECFSCQAVCTGTCVRPE